MYENYPIENLNLATHRIMSADEANLWSMRVVENADLWERRVGIFYTMGATSYLDLPEIYKTSAKELNPLMLDVFADLYKRINKVLGGALFHPELGVPGFHIFDRLCNGKTGDIHIDIPFDQQDIPFEYSRPFTFTLCLAVPKVGAGLHYWDDLTKDEQIDMLDGDELPAKRNYLAYEPGVLYVHSGMCPHQIAQVGNMNSGEYRITLQGHGLHTASGQVVVYF